MRHTRAEVLERAVREFEALDLLIANLAEHDWNTPVGRPEGKDPWTVKDAIVHIVYWKAHTARAIRGERRPPEIRGLDVPRLNHRVYEEWRQRTADDVIGWHREVHAEVLRALAARPDEWFTGRERGAPWPADLDSHSAGHRKKDIEAVVGRPPVHDG